MCLYNESKVKITEKNIIVYKVMYSYNNIHFQSPWQRTIYPIKLCNKEKDFKKRDTCGFYSFNTINGAKKYSKYMKNWEARKIPIIVKCIIPKGSKYVDGVQDLLEYGKYKAKRSKNIIFVKIFKEKHVPT